MPDFNLRLGHRGPGGGRGQRGGRDCVHLQGHNPYHPGQELGGRPPVEGIPGPATLLALLPPAISTIHEFAPARSPRRDSERQRGISGCVWERFWHAGICGCSSPGTQQPLCATLASMISFPWTSSQAPRSPPPSACDPPLVPRALLAAFSPRLLRAGRLRQDA